MERNSGRNADQIQLPAQFREHRVGGRVNPRAAFPELSDLRRRLFRIDDDCRGELRNAQPHKPDDPFKMIVSVAGHPDQPDSDFSHIPYILVNV